MGGLVESACEQRERIQVMAVVSWISINDRVLAQSQHLSLQIREVQMPSLSYFLINFNQLKFSSSPQLQCHVVFSFACQYLCFRNPHQPKKQEWVRFMRQNA